MERYCVRISQDDLVFSAGHFITYEGDACEPLHGHDYRVSAEVQGPLDENQYVVDFLTLRDALKAIVDQLDHRVLLPSEHPRISVSADEREVEVTFEARRWVFPRGDCVLLPLANTTTELLARHVARRLLAELQTRCGTRPPRVRVEITECYGQSASCELCGG
jgi:6-pyruvoyltetrahydropterin/6-carboxytetrahydropterin synthase